MTKNDPKTKKACFTGHRKEGLPFGADESREECRKLISLLEEQIERLYNEKGVRVFISGMALGTDQIAAEAVIRFRETHKDVVLVAALPCTDQCKSWKMAEQDRYHGILALADHVYTLEPEYVDGCMLARNRFMVNNCEYVIAVWNGKRIGGTWSTVSYARSNNRTLTIINPVTFDVTEEKKKIQ